MLITFRLIFCGIGLHYRLCECQPIRTQYVVCVSVVGDMTHFQPMTVLHFHNGTTIERVFIFN